MRLHPEHGAKGTRMTWGTSFRKSFCPHRVLGLCKQRADRELLQRKDVFDLCYGVESSQRKGFNYRFLNHILSTASAAYFDDCGCCHFFSPNKQEGKRRCVWVPFCWRGYCFSSAWFINSRSLHLLAIIQPSEKQVFPAFCISQ